MMPDYLEFLFRQAVVWVVLLLFYQLAFHRNDNWSLKRKYLLAAYLLGWLIPALPALLPAPAVTNLPIAGFLTEATIAVSSVETAGTETGRSLTPWHVAGLIYLLGAMLQLCIITGTYLRLNKWKAAGPAYLFGKYPVIRHPLVASPLAGLGAIFLPKDLEEADEKMICLHEQAHLQRRHNLERQILLPGRVLLWFHPLQWLYTFLQSELQEYEADEAVLKKFPVKAYGQLLIKTSMLSTIGWRARFYSSPLKKRINMMIRKKIRSTWQLTHSAVLAFVLGLLLINCSDLVEADQLSSSSYVAASEVEQGPFLKVDGSGVTETEREKVLLEKIYRTIKYPTDARTGGVEGFFEASFVVDEKGLMEQLEAKRVEEDQVDRSSMIVITGYAPEGATPRSDGSNGVKILEREIEETLQALPDWEPARQKGKTQAVSMKMYFQYLLE